MVSKMAVKVVTAYDTHQMSLEDLDNLLPSLLSDPLLFIVVRVCMSVHINKLVFKPNVFASRLFLCLYFVA